MITLQRRTVLINPDTDHLIVKTNSDDRHTKEEVSRSNAQINARLDIWHLVGHI